MSEDIKIEKAPLFDELEARILSSIVGTPVIEATDAFTNLIIKYMIISYENKEDALKRIDHITKEISKAINLNHKFRKKLIEKMTKPLN